MFNSNTMVVAILAFIKISCWTTSVSKQRVTVVTDAYSWCQIWWKSVLPWNLRWLSSANIALNYWFLNSNSVSILWISVQWVNRRVTAVFLNLERARDFSINTFLSCDDSPRCRAFSVFFFCGKLSSDSSSSEVSLPESWSSAFWVNNSGCYSKKLLNDQSQNIFVNQQIWQSTEGLPLS